MAEPAQAPTVRLAAAPGPDAEGKDGDGGGLAGRMLDVAGIAAGVVLAVIAFDIISGGKLSMKLRAIMARRRGDCDGCGDQAQEDGGGGDS